MNSQKTYKVVVFVVLNIKSMPDACRGIVHFVESHPEWDVSFSHDRSPNILTRDSAEADGFIVLAKPGDLPRNLLKARKPMVIIDPHFHPKPAPNVCEHMIDNVKIGTTAARHLLALRHCKSYAFALPNYPGVTQTPVFVRDRREAFASALRARGVACATIAPGEENIILAALTKPVAVFAATDERAAELIQEARKIGLRAPRDLAVLGVDNSTILCESTTPPLSSLEVDFIGSAMQACQELDDMMHGKSVPSKVIYDGEVRLIARKSTSAPDASGHLVTRALNLVQTRAASGLTVNEAASILGVSRRLLALRIREATGQTLQDLIAENRFEEVTRLLRQTSLPLKVVADTCGFRNLSHFMTAFRRRFGKTPSAYRAQFQQGRHT